MSKRPQAITKSEFAELCSVSRGRVSQWIKAGLISDKAFVGEGRRAKINPEIARRQLRERLSVGQLFGNGADTKLAEPASEEKALPEVPTVEDSIRAEKLREYQARNRRALAEERARNGLYMRTAVAGHD